MAGTLLDRQLTAPTTTRSKVRFGLATDEDEPAIRRLLRENPMPGGISLSFEREPNYFHNARLAGAEDRTIVAFEGGRLVCIGRCSVRPRYVNGAVRRVGYLSDLRLDASTRGRFDILRRGYEFFRELHLDKPADVYFTSIAADNQRSIRFLERGLPGIPAYEFLGDFVTLLIATPRSGRAARRIAKRGQNRLKARGWQCAAGSSEHRGKMVSCLNSHAQQHQLGCFWTEDDLRSLETSGLTPADVRLLLDDNRVVGCGALWDQRCFKQTVIRSYGRKLALARPWINLAAGLSGTPRLPAIGSTLAFGFLSPLAVPAGDEQALHALIELSLSLAAGRGLEFLVLGFASRDRRLATVRNYFHCREYWTRLYGVRWDERAHWRSADQPPTASGRDAFHRVPDFFSEDGDAVERVPTKCDGRLTQGARVTASVNVLDERPIFPEVAWL